MKAVVILCICLSAVSSHVLTKRSLLGRGSHGHGHGHQQRQGLGHRGGAGHRRGREEVPEEQPEEAELRGAPEGYLPPSDEDYQDESLGGYGAEEGEQGQYGDSQYDDDSQQGQYGAEDQYDEE